MCGLIFIGMAASLTVREQKSRQRLVKETRDGASRLLENNGTFLCSSDVSSNPLTSSKDPWRRRLRMQAVQMIIKEFRSF